MSLALAFMQRGAVIHGPEFFLSNFC